ncbi:LuxR C-terminal-related transcriptional regulator [Micromonospora sp. NPDC007230]|uniref:LuxR C-terminal-related transcriptional regulator n=1 Tax=Micromonospora sp. NPDC007230 TaxID=3364237 RepID=UPI00369758D4
MTWSVNGGQGPERCGSRFPTGVAAPGRTRSSRRSSYAPNGPITCGHYASLDPHADSAVCRVATDGSGEVRGADMIRSRKPEGWQMMSEESMSAGLGMPNAAAAIYLFLLERPTATTAELAAACDLDADGTIANLTWLRDHGLVLRAKAMAITGVPDQWSAAEPDHALRDLVRARERTLHDVRAALPELQERFRQVHHDSMTGQALEHVHGWENVGARYHQILRDATEEVALLDHRPYTPGAAPTEESILNRGVRFRVMCDPVDLPQQLADEFAALRGLEARLHPDVPFRGVIVDRKIALITMDRAPQNMSAIVVRPSPLLDGLVLLFDACWSRAVPLGMDEIALEGQGLQVLKLLAAGLKDEAIARQLNTTTRTIRRRVQDVLTALHAKSRFHAGVEASRRGWV